MRPDRDAISCMISIFMDICRIVDKSTCMREQLCVVDGAVVLTFEIPINNLWSYISSLIHFNLSNGIPAKICSAMIGYYATKIPFIFYHNCCYIRNQNVFE